MGSYRFELAPSNRSGCTNKECKDAKVKILKGELRLGSWIENDRFQGYQWRHWGCTTPKVVDNIAKAWKETLPSDELDYALLDGYDELPEEWQSKIRTALSQGHVDDTDWKGDVEVNRPGKTGFRVRGAAKKAKEAAREKAATAESSDANDDTEAAEPIKEKPKKAAAKDGPESSNDADASEKAKPKAKKAARGKKAAVKEDAEASGAEKEEQKPSANTKKPRVKKATTDAAAEAEPKKRGRPSKKTATDTPAQPAKKATKRKTSDEDDQDAESDKPKRARGKAGGDKSAAPAKRKSGRKKAAEE